MTRWTIGYPSGPPDPPPDPDAVTPHPSEV